MLIVSVLSCSERQVMLTDDDLIIENKIYSPSGNKIILTYAFDHGAFGQSKYFHTIIETKDSLKEINKNEFSDKGEPSYISIEPVKWLTENKIEATIDPRPFARLNKQIDTADFWVGTNQIKVSIKDITEGNLPIIEYFELSPNSKTILVAYRYIGASQLEVSVVDRNEKLPMVGNIYSSFRIGNPILAGRWIDDNTIELDVNSNDIMVDLHEGAICKSDYSIELNIIDYNSGYSSISGGWYNKEPYYINQSEELFKNSARIQGKISEGFSWGDGYYTKLKNIGFEYSYDGVSYKSYFRTSINNIEFEIGKVIELEINKDQPIIHRTMEEYSR
jgi:hypothetical protein